MNKCDFCLYKTEKEASKSQFNMCWAKIQEIANILRISKIEVYHECLRNYGQATIFKVDAIGLSVLQEQYELTEVMLMDKEWYTVKAYKGIEYMNSNELSIFTDGVVEDLNNVRD